MQALAQADARVGRPFDPAVFEFVQGARVVRGEVIALAADAQALERAQALNFSILRQEQLPGLGLGYTILAAPPGMNAAEALAALRNADPDGVYDYNHLFDPSADTAVGTAQEEADTRAPLGLPDGLAIGLVDAGIDRTHPDLAGAEIIAANIVGAGEGPPSAHGTALASLLVGDGAVSGVARGAKLYAADVYGGLPGGGSADAVTRGIAWAAQQGATVINVSLAGPHNALLKSVIDAIAVRGHVIVAAVGNDGPAAPVAFPAAYPGVVAVTSVDEGRRIQIDANRGPEVQFAARGVAVKVATPGGGYGTATGTSFAAPLIAGRLAQMMPAPDPASASSALQSLQVQAVDLGKPGRDPVFGYGYIEVHSHHATALSRN